MKFNISIPTLNRKQKLINCIASIIVAKKDNDISLNIYFNSEKELKEIHKRFNRFTWVHYHCLDNYRVPNFWNNILNKMKEDALIYLNDDVELYSDTLNIINEQFTDKDSVMGINQINLGQRGLDSAYGVIGSVYANRFPSKQVFCPDYFRFYADKELGEYAKSINKFKFCKEARINHLHPSIDSKYQDSTHVIVRQWLGQDKTIYNLRKDNNFLWGRDFNNLEIN